MKKNKKSASKYEGLQEDVRSLKTPEIEIWENQYKDKTYTISIRTDEFSCICPKTTLPDFADISIEYIPDKYCIELKSFKMYLLFFRSLGIFHEHLANRILDDIVAACNPRYAKITTVFKSRGGINTTVSRQYEKNKR
jgi:7-cyano-7-deazaguanine reductase